MQKFLNDEGDEVEAFSKEEYETLTTENTRLGTELADKVKHLEEKNQQLSGLRQGYKKVSDMSETDRNLLTEKEKELMTRTEQLEEANTRERNGKMDRIFNNLTGGDMKLKEKMEEHYKIIGLPDGTEEEIARKAGYALQNARMDLGIMNGPDAMATAMGAMGSNPRVRGSEEKTTQEVERGKALEDLLNLNPNK